MSQKRFTGAKIVIFGSSGVGKTAFAVRYITKRYIGDYDRDKETVYTHKLATAREDLNLEILDTGSQPSQDIMEKHIRWGDGFVLLYSLIDQCSCEYLVTVRDTIARIKGPEPCMVLVGNKHDIVLLRETAEITDQECLKNFDCPKFEISVAEGSQGVLEVMEELMCQLKRDFIKNLAPSNMSGLENKPRSKLYSMKKAFKKRINRSHSDTF